MQSKTYVSSVCKSWVSTHHFKLIYYNYQFTVIIITCKEKAIKTRKVLQTQCSNFLKIRSISLSHNTINLLLRKIKALNLDQLYDKHPQALHSIHSLLIHTKNPD